MCGIGGIVRYGFKPINEETVGILLVGNEHRGNDAAGIVFQQENGELNWFKQDVPSWKMVSTDEYAEFIKNHLKPTTRTVLVHARGASKGNPRDNNNNHPMTAGKACIIHNGVIRNDNAIFALEKLERKAATDSDIIRAIIDEHGIGETTIRKLGLLVGSGAIAAVHPEFPNKLLLTRSGNPIVMASTPDFLFFSSEKQTLHKACRPWVNRFGLWFQENIPNIAFSYMADDTAWIFGPKGLEAHIECKINHGGYKEPWRQTYEEYTKRSRKWDDEVKKPASKAPIVVMPPVKGHEPDDVDQEMKQGMCPACGKTWVLPRKDKYEKWFCNQDSGGCNTRLMDPQFVHIDKKLQNRKKIN